MTSLRLQVSNRPVSFPATPPKCNEIPDDFFHEIIGRTRDGWNGRFDTLLRSPSNVSFIIVSELALTESQKQFNIKNF